MDGRVQVLILWVCLCGFGIDVARCQKEKYAPRNVTATSDVSTLYVTWLTPEAAASDTQIDEKLTAFRVRVEPKKETQLVRELWVPKSTGDAPYGHKVTCLRPSVKYQVTVLAVYSASANISDSDAISWPVDKYTRAKSIWNELGDHPIPMAVGASMMLLIVIIVVSALLIYRCHRLRRRGRRMDFTSSDHVSAGQRETYRKSPSPSTKLPSAKELRDREQRNNYYMAPVTAPSALSPARAIQQPRTANQRSPLIQYSPPSSYQASTSVPSQAAPGRPGEDSDDQESEDYENVLAVNTPVQVIIKSTSFSAGCRPKREGVRIPTSINEGQHGEEDGDEEDGDVGTYENNVFGRRCATMPSKSKGGGRGAQVEEKECYVYGNWQR